MLKIHAKVLEEKWHYFNFFASSMHGIQIIKDVGSWTDFQASHMSVEYYTKLL